MVLCDFQLDFEEFWFLKTTVVSNIIFNGYAESKSTNNYEHMNESYDLQEN